MDNPLLKQLENSRLKHAIDYVKHSTTGIKKLNSNELARLNQIITGTDQDPWRSENMKIRLPTGKVREFSMISNPVVQTRDILSKGYELLIDGEDVEAATYVYAQLVIGHFFRDANRRTAVVAALWMLSEHGKTLDAEILLKNKLGDLSESGEIENLKNTISRHIK